MNSGILTPEEFHDIIQKIRKHQDFSPLYRVVTLDLSVARTLFPFDLAGGYLEIIAATDSNANIDIRFNEIQNDTVNFRNGDSVVTPFFRVFLSNAVQAGKTITFAVSLSFDLWRIIRSQQVLIGGTITSDFLSVAGGFTQDYTRQLGSVQTLLLDRARGSQIFERWEESGASAGNVSPLQVFNPVASGKTVIVLTVFWSAAAAGNALSITQHNTALTTLVGTFFNVNSGGAASTAELRKANPAAVPGTEIMKIDAGGQGVIPLERADVLGAGEGLVVSQTNSTLATRAGFRIWEF